MKPRNPLQQPNHIGHLQPILGAQVFNTRATYFYNGPRDKIPIKSCNISYTPSTPVDQYNSRLTWRLKFARVMHMSHTCRLQFITFNYKLHLMHVIYGQSMITCCQCSGRFLGIISQNPSVSKLNRFHVDSTRYVWKKTSKFSIELGIL
jgi:hypothetical protein